MCLAAATPGRRSGDQVHTVKKNKTRTPLLPFHRLGTQTRRATRFTSAVLITFLDAVQNYRSSARRTWALSTTVTTPALVRRCLPPLHDAMGDSFDFMCLIAATTGRVRPYWACGRALTKSRKRTVNEHRFWYFTASVAECFTNEFAWDYKGLQDTTVEGNQCLAWDTKTKASQTCCWFHSSAAAVASGIGFPWEGWPAQLLWLVFV